MVTTLANSLRMLEQQQRKCSINVGYPMIERSGRK